MARGNLEVGDMRSIADYEEALRRYNRITPIRGSDIRPLRQSTNGRRAHHLRVEMKGTDIQCVLYDTPCVVFHADNTVTINTEHWPTVSTYKFITKICPWVTSMFYAGRQGSGIRIYAEGEYKTYRMQRSIKFSADRKPIDNLPFHIHKANRKALNAMRKKLQPFLAYVVGIGKLTQWDRLEEEIEHGYAWGTALEANTLMDKMQSGDLDDWYKLYVYINRLRGKSRSYWNGGTWTSRYTFKEADIKWFVNDVAIKSNPLEFLTRVELPIGEYQRDSNYRYGKAYETAMENNQ